MAGDSDGFAIGERIHSPIHVYARIIPVDYSNLSAITTYIRGLKNSLNFVPAEKIFG